MLYYTTIGGEQGRASFYFKSEDKAKARCDDQNARAEGMGIKARYSVESRPEEGIEAKEIR